MILPFDIPADRHVLIAGPTASGKSALALQIAAAQGGLIVNADAIQVYANWRILTARPTVAEEAAHPHALYGHVPHDGSYSVGHWLRAVSGLLDSGQRLIIVGGTGLYFRALTHGLADMPATPSEIRTRANALLDSGGKDQMLAALDPATRARIDTANPMRVQRAWEVQQATGLGLAHWQDATPPALLAPAHYTPIVFDVTPHWLNARINQRFDRMLALGALDEARSNLPGWNPDHLSAKAIGAPELIAHLQGHIPLETAHNLATTATRQFAKRQRTWFRSKMQDWQPYRPEPA